MTKHINLYYGYINTHTIDANKHPDEQVEDLIALIKNHKEETINIYSNSPYVMFRITLLFGYSNNNIPVEKRLYGDITITNKHFEVLKDGSIVEGEYYKGMMSDECLLNNKLAETNDLYSDLLDLENQLRKGAGSNPVPTQRNKRVIPKVSIEETEQLNEGVDTKK